MSLSSSSDHAASPTPKIKPLKTSDVKKSVGKGCRRLALFMALIIGTTCYFILQAGSNLITGEDLGTGFLFALVILPCSILICDLVICNRCCRDPDPELCPLCHHRVEKANWDNGTHREECYRLNFAIISKYQVLYPNVKCPTCSKPLPVWPADACEKFSCFSCPAVTRSSILNNGCNLFKCFECNYDLCLNCVTKKVQSREQKQLSQQRQEMQQEIQRLREETRELREARALVHEGPERPPPSYDEIEASEETEKLCPKRDLP